MKRRKTTSRLFEQILGVTGSFLGLMSGSYIFLIPTQGFLISSSLATMAILGSFLGFLSSFYINKDLEYCGVGFIISAMLMLIATPEYGIFGSILVLGAGISALFRK